MQADFGSLVLSGLAAMAFAMTAHAAEPVATQTVALQRHDAGTFYVKASVQGAGEMDLLVDTGSSYLVLGDDIVQSLEAQGLAKLHHKVRGRMADESVRIVPIYTVAALRLGPSCWVHDVKTAVFPAGSRPILGMQTLERLAPITMSTSPATLDLNQCAMMAAQQDLAAALPEAALE